MATTRRSGESIRSRALNAGKEHRVRVAQAARLFHLSPEALRRDLKRRLGDFAAAGAIREGEREALAQTIDLVTAPDHGERAELLAKVRKIRRDLGEARSAKPAALVIVAIAEDSVATAAKGVQGRGTKDAGSEGGDGRQTRQKMMPSAVLWADVAGALLAGAWCVAHGTSASFMLEEMKTGAIYMSAAALGLVTE